MLLATARRYDQRGGNPIFRAIFTAAGRNRSFRGVVGQKKYRLTFRQLRTPHENEPLGEALTEAIRHGLEQVVEAENINPAQYFLLLAIHSNSFTNIWAQSARHVPLNEWLHNQEYARSYLEQLARKLNSAQVVDPERDGFLVEMSFVKTFGRGVKTGGKKGNPGKMAWERMGKKKKCIVQIKSKDDLCLPRTIVTMKERADKGSHHHNLRQGKPIQERWARLLHQQANVAEGPCGLEELETFQEYLGPHGYQIIVVEPSKCLVVFKDPTYNEAPHLIGLVKYNGHYDGLTSIPALMNRSYYCRHCDRGYDREQAYHHNCFGQNCSACCRQNKTCPNFATWVKPTVHCPDCNCMFYGQDCFQAHKTKGKKRGDESICDTWKKCPLCRAEYQVNPKKPHKCYHVTCRNCGEFTHVAHRCCIQPIKEEVPPQPREDAFEDPMYFQFDDDDDDDDKRGPPPPPVLNFADIECAISEDRVFQPNLICWSSEEDEEIHHARTIEEFLEACEALTEVEDDERPRKVITFFHNLRGFDGNFVLEALYDQGRAVENPLTQGAKILYFESGDLIFEDSLNFCAMPLERFSATFNLTEPHKGYFPHAFNREEHFNYAGHYPPMSEYDPDSMDSKKREKFMSWYRQKVAENAVFDFQEELLKYCESDVKLLKEGCLKFMREFEEIARFNPLITSVTIASACNHFWRKEKLEENLMLSSL